MKQSGLKRVGAVVGVCALVGARAGIAGSAAAPSKSKSAQPQKRAKAQKNGSALRHGLRGGPGAPGLFRGPGGPGGAPVHSESVVPNADGTGFDTITTDGGKLTSVDGNTLKITEGTDKAKYKDVAIDVGANPTVFRNRAKAALGDLKAGDNVRVIRGTTQGTFVIAEDAAFTAQLHKEHPGFGRGHGGPPPPPGAPAAPGDNENGSSSSGSSSGGSNS
jgi:hypothetical protein